ncbi:LuxR C-terminal-related transcriptional regulator [Microtetraspora sp. NBRC 13810]|uniref:LuxR C-terminal-related transcriptional regulator n=1 Tax=Microtetraspora sp. NBRC 13810 TaxID=3030990 RepID=UPI002552E31B|nr:LuxR C-terminal-related transcriptional regulator [Microtetraspora sp. NBRC 13810]
MTAVAGVAVAFPSVAATTCPGCYGMKQVRPGLYLEPGLPAARERQVTEVVDAAGRRVADFYGGRRSSPDILACLTDTCYQKIGGGRERGIAVLNRAVMLSPNGIDPVIAAHEMSHVELHARLGSGAGPMPQWFDEGLAVVVSGDPRYLKPETAGNRCRVSTQEALPRTLDDWLRTAKADRDTYAKAACRVSRWLQANGGSRAVLELIEHLAGGGELPTSLAAASRSNTEIAAALTIEEGTVKTHVARILSKLGLRTRVHAVIYAYEHGLAPRGNRARTGRPVRSDGKIPARRRTRFSCTEPCSSRDGGPHVTA